MKSYEGDTTRENQTHPVTNDVAPSLDKSDPDKFRRSHRLKLKTQRIMRQNGEGGFSLSNISVKRSIQYDPRRTAEAIHKELEHMLTGKKVFVPVKRSYVPKNLVIRSHMFLKYNFDAQGKLEKLKARLVADGRVQDRDQYPVKYCLTISLEATTTTLKLAAVSNKNIAKLDIKGAYLNTYLDEELYLELCPHHHYASGPDLDKFVEA